MIGIYKVGDRVYHWRFGWGTVIEFSIKSSYPIKVVNNDKRYYYFTVDGRFLLVEPPTLSFTYYDLVNGGFSQERPKPDIPTKQIKLREDIEQAINKHSIENGSNTPDFILAEYLIDCLRAFDETIAYRTDSNDKSIDAWLNELPEEIQRKARMNCTGWALKEKTRSLPEALSIAFDWNDTPEGYDYWFKVYNDLRRLMGWGAT